MKSNVCNLEIQGKLFMTFAASWIFSWWLNFKWAWNFLFEIIWIIFFPLAWLFLWTEILIDFWLRFIYQMRLNLIFVMKFQLKINFCYVVDLVILWIVNYYKLKWGTTERVSNEVHQNMGFLEPPSLFL